MSDTRDDLIDETEVDDHAAHGAEDSADDVVETVETAVANTGDLDIVDGEPGEMTEPTVAPLIETLDAADLKTATDQPSAEEEAVVPDVSDLPPAELRAAVEAVLFVATKPLTIARLQRVLPGTSPTYLEGFLTGLAARFDRENRGWELRHIAGGWQMLTRRELHPFFQVL